MEQKIKKFKKVFPWYVGLSGDLLFWGAIDTLFLTTVKGLEASQIVSLSTVSLIICIIMQLPLLKLIKKIGNTNSVRVGALMFLIASALLTLGEKYIVIMLGQILYELAFTFRNMANAILKNNLELQNEASEYIKIKTRANTVYAVATMIVSLIVSTMFNMNNYLPMFGCMSVCFICFILAFGIVDYSNNKSITENRKKEKIQYGKIILLLIIIYGLFYTIVNQGQSNGKLFIQQQLLLNYDVAKTATVIGIIVFVSRIVRVISNMSFSKIYEKYQTKMGMIFPIMLSIAILNMILGSIIENNLTFKFIIMSIGYIIIVFIRDPFEVYMQDLALKNVGQDKQQTLLTIMELASKIGRAIIGVSFSIILLKEPMISIIIILFILSIAEILMSIKLYKMVNE